MSTGYSNSYNNNTTNNATSTPPNAEPLLDSNRTIPGWFSQQTRGWPWSSWTNRTTSTKPKLYYRIPTSTKYSPRTPPPTSKTNSLPFLRTLSKQEAYPPKNTNNSTQPVQSLPNSMASPKSIKQAPLSDPLFPVGVNHLWGCQGALPHHQTPCRPVPTPPQKHSTLYPVGTRGNHHLL